MFANVSWSTCGWPAPRRPPSNPTEHRSIGIVAFSEAQQGEIEDALERLAARDATFRDALDAELIREEDGQYAGLLVKNLENIQGDERDVIILSVCYGHNPQGRMRMNFGPINQSGGEKRLNVAFSRSKHHMVLVSSIRPEDIKNDYNPGANCLKNYLRYAAACSTGNISGANNILREMCPWHEGSQDHRKPQERLGVLATSIAAALEHRGFKVHHGVGMSDFRCDLAVRMEGEETYRLGILLDSGDFYDEVDVLEREVNRPRLLSVFGWRIARVTTADWYDDPGGVTDNLVKILEGRSEPDTIQPDEDFAADLADRLRALEPDESADANVPAPARKETQTGGIPAIGVPPLLGIQDVVPRYFEFVGGRSNKYWEITVSENRYSVRFGRIGTAGQERLKTFKDATAARRAASKAINSKLDKGYEEKDRT